MEPEALKEFVSSLYWYKLFCDVIWRTMLKTASFTRVFAGITWSVASWFCCAFATFCRFVINFQDGSAHNKHCRTGFTSLETVGSRQFGSSPGISKSTLLSTESVLVKPVSEQSIKGHDAEWKSFRVGIKSGRSTAPKCAECEAALHEAVHKSLCCTWFGVLFCHAAQIGSRSVPG